METTKKRKWLTVMSRTEVENLEKMISALYGEVLSARTLLNSVINASENDPFREARLYLAEGECSKAVGNVDALIRYIDKKTSGS